MHTGKYVAINEVDITTMGYYSVKYVSDAFTVPQYTTTNRKIIKSGELEFRAEYLCYMKAKKIGIVNRKK